jgi:polyhydroxyalkanoate synthesis repressor PhaR
VAGPLIIKKYSNRRLYHTEEKCYITLENVAALIRHGREVTVIDNQTQEDITKETLLQIILAGDKSQNLFSSALLHQMIRLQEDHLQEFTQYLGSSLDYFTRLKQSMVQQFDLWNQFWLGSFVPPSSSAEEKTPQPAVMSAPLDFLQRQLEEYRQKIQVLEKQLQTTGKEKS